MQLIKCVSILILTLFLSNKASSQSAVKPVYKKKVLNATEIEFLSSYYLQKGNNAAVTGGVGTEELSDATGTLVVSIPLNDDDVLTIDAGVSAYTSASSSNIDPFDGEQNPDAFQASSGASHSDAWSNVTISYRHSSDDRNTILGFNASLASEYDYFSLGVGASVARLSNQKNTELSATVHAYADSWNALYPQELRPFTPQESGLESSFFRNANLTGNLNYQPQFTSFGSTNRNTLAIGFRLSQILSQRMQGSLVVDVVGQNGLLSTPFQRVYFEDVEDSFIDGFHLAEDIERLPGSRVKIAIGGRLNYYVNQNFVIRTFFRQYLDDWGISSQTVSLEVPIKMGMNITLLPSYRLYSQSSSAYFREYNKHHSSEPYYTSDYDLSGYNANQYALGLRYKNPLGIVRIGKSYLSTIQLKYMLYDRNIPGWSASMVLGSLKFKLG